MTTTPATPTDTAAPSVAIIRTGSANLASVLAAFARLGCESLVTVDAHTVRHAPLVILPGVGAFGPAMDQLRDSGLDTALVHRVRAGLPLLAICLGLQLLCDASEESPGVAGLGVVPSRVTRFAPTMASAGPPLRIPQMGWNQITPTIDATLLAPSHMYFANSYRLSHIPSGWEGAVSHYAGPFVAALERGPLLACQFHPELSGLAGLDLLKRWLVRSGAAPPLSPSRAGSSRSAPSAPRGEQVPC